MLKNKTVLLTGANGGIGSEVAKILSVNGVRLILVGLDGASLEQLNQKLGDRNRTVIADISTTIGRNKILKACDEDEQGIDILINNAGLTDDNLALRMKIDQWSKVIDSNLTGTFLLCQKFLRPMLKKRHGRIINISSVVAAMGNPGQCNYSAAKAGLEAMSKSLAKEIAGRGITVNSIAPGFVETDMTAAMEDGVREQMIASIPVGYMGQPEDIAAAAQFLASDSARYITGHTLQVNGGIYM